MKRSAAETDHNFARAAGAHRHVERENDGAAIGRRGAAQRIEADGVVVAREAVKLKPENVRRDFRDFLDGRAAGHAERVRDPRALRGTRQNPIGARPHDRRPAHRRNADRRGVAAAEQFDLAGRQRRHDAIARHQFDGVERRPIALDAGIVLARAAIGIFKGEMRQAPPRAAAQIIDGRIVPVEFGVAWIAVAAGRQAARRRGDGRRIVHERFSQPPL